MWSAASQALDHAVESPLLRRDLKKFLASGRYDNVLSVKLTAFSEPCTLRSPQEVSAPVLKNTFYLAHVSIACAGVILSLSLLNCEIQQTTFAVSAPLAP